MANIDSYSNDYGNPWAMGDDTTFGTDFDLGIDWDSFGPATFDGGTLDTFNVNTTPDDYNVGGGWGYSDDEYTFGGGGIYDDVYGLGGIGDPLGDIGAVYIPDTPLTPTPANPATRPTTNNPSPRPSTGVGSAPSSSSSRPSSSTSGNAAQDIAKLVNSILQAFKPTPTNVQGQPVSTPAPVGSGFDFGSFGMLAIGAGAVWLLMRKK